MLEQSVATVQKRRSVSCSSDIFFLFICNGHSKQKAPAVSFPFEFMWTRTPGKSEYPHFSIQRVWIPDSILPAAAVMLVYVFNSSATLRRNQRDTISTCRQGKCFIFFVFIAVEFLGGTISDGCELGMSCGVEFAVIHDQNEVKRIQGDGKWWNVNSEYIILKRTQLLRGDLLNKCNISCYHPCIVCLLFWSHQRLNFNIPLCRPHLWCIYPPVFICNIDISSRDTNKGWVSLLSHIDISLKTILVLCEDPRAHLLYIVWQILWGKTPHWNQKLE